MQVYNIYRPRKFNIMGAGGKSAEIEVNPPLTIEPDTDNAGVGNSSFSLAVFLG